ncbi:uncharacterized protein V1518DRAFT_407601 [Limtongia smithiae]|uniref:uncharacterized protein n=1 Tax=Limtongia smithiae TaxID=1125753 RepID=UPI0034CF727E
MVGPVPASSPEPVEAVSTSAATGDNTETGEIDKNGEGRHEDGDADMFDEEFDEEEFSAFMEKEESSPTKPLIPSVNVRPADVQIAEAITGVTTELMALYYQRLFPFKDLFLWLNHSPVPNASFTNREVAFTLQNDVYVRYLSFATHDAMKREVVRLNPARFEIGPMYSANPRDRKLVRKNAFRPLEKELVFDIDMTDYDDVRTCCTGATICGKCWKFITAAIKVMDRALRMDFGFKHVLWVYSGRRGAHAWVCDKRARVLDDGKRRAIAAYFEVLKGGAKNSKRVNLRRPLHPSLQRSLTVLREYFSSAILADQNPWQGSYDKLLQLLPDKQLNEALRKKWDDNPEEPSTIKWADIDKLAQQGVSKTLDPKELMEAKQDIVLEYLYPRLDAEVSKHLNHLLKSPFCIHPGTGRVCVPINSARPETFDPLDVPTVAQLLEEIDLYVEKSGGADEPAEKTVDVEKTSLKPYVEYFHRFVAELMKEEMKEKRRLDEDSKDALDF